MKHVSTIHRSSAFNFKKFLDERNAYQILALNDFFIKSERWETYQYWVDGKHYTTSLKTSYPYTVVTIDLEDEIISEFTIYKFLISGKLEPEGMEGWNFIRKLEESSYEKKQHTYYPPFNQYLKKKA